MTRFERRAARAERLAAGSESARAVLELAAVLWRAQGQLREAFGAVALVGRPGDDLVGARDAVAALLTRVAEHAPAPLAIEARTRAAEDPRVRFVPWWEASRSGRDDFLARAVARPYVELLVARGLAPGHAVEGGARCRVCGGLPWVGFRRAPAGGGDGGERFVVCALCGGEEAALRIQCPACGEQAPEKLPVFQGDRHPAVRVEACQTCRAYLKSIDLTVDARALPEVDELVSLSLDLWAEENGYVRIEPGLAGI